MYGRYPIRLEVPVGRISISQATIHAMKDPQFVALGIEANPLVLKIFRVPYGLRVRVTSSKEFYIKSKEMMKGLCEIIPLLNEPCSYKLWGKIYEDGMRFPLDTLEKIERPQNESSDD